MSHLRAVPDSNVAELPIGNLRDIPDMARRFAGYVEEGRWGEVTRAVVIVEYDEGLAIMGWGENGSPYEMMGLFEAAKLRVFADDIIDD